MKKVYIVPSTVVSQNYFCNSIIATSAPTFSVDNESSVYEDDEHHGTIGGVIGDAPGAEGSDSKRRNLFYE